MEPSGAFTRVAGRVNSFILHLLFVHLIYFRQWDGKLRATQAFKLRRIKYVPDGTNAVQDMDTDEPNEVDFDATTDQNSESD